MQLCRAACSRDSKRLVRSTNARSFVSLTWAAFSTIHRRRDILRLSGQHASNHGHYAHETANLHAAQRCAFPVPDPTLHPNPDGTPATDIAQPASWSTASRGWRLVFALVAAVSAVIGLLNFLFARDPNFATAGGEKSERSALPGGGLAEIGRQIWAVLTIPTFLIIVLQARVLLLRACLSQPVLSVPPCQVVLRSVPPLQIALRSLLNILSWQYHVAQTGLAAAIISEPSLLPKDGRVPYFGEATEKA